MTRYTKNDSYFKEPNIDNCYWAGFIAADGCLDSSEYPRLSFGLNPKDKNILEEFIKQTSYNGHIYEGGQIDARTKCFYPVAKLRISAKHWVDDLNKHWNIIPKKSLILEPPNLTDLQHKLSYIVGYIDGDGFISHLKSKHCKLHHIAFGMVGTKPVLNWISNTLYTIENQSKYPCPVSVNVKGNAYSILYVRKRAINILHHLNAISTPYRLERKWNKIQLGNLVNAAL